MSRLTKYLKQFATYQRVQRDEFTGDPVLDQYGKPLYDESVDIKCRKQQVSDDVQTSNGSIVRSSSQYYLDLDTTVTIEDLLDGRVVLQVEDYVGATGRHEGYFVRVV